MAKQELGPWQTAWVESLESGNFAQTDSILCYVEKNKGYSYCCLGLACEVALQNGIEIDVFEPEINHINTNGVLRYNNCTDFLSKEIIELFQFRDRAGFFHIEDLDESSIKKVNGYLNSFSEINLSTLNDNGMSFKEIAEIVRKNPSAFFKKPV